MARSPARTALLLVGLLGAAVAGEVVGLPHATATIVATSVGSGLLIHDRDRRREERARARAGAGVDGYPLRLAAERVAVGRRIQFRLVGATRQVWAPGMLYVREGEARFVPSLDRHGARAWGGKVVRAEITTSKLVGTSVRLFAPDGAAAQFVLSDPPANVAEAIPAWIEATAPQ